MPTVTHMHAYHVSPSLEALDLATLLSYEEKTKPNGNSSHFADLLSEIALHPDLPPGERHKYIQLRRDADEDLYPDGKYKNLHDTTAILGHIFLPLALGLEETPKKRLDEVVRRANAMLDACEDRKCQTSQVIGASSELYVNFALWSEGMTSLPCLGRENMGFVYEDKKFACDAMIRWRQHGATRRYRAQIKHNTSESYDYHPGIVMLFANPRDEFHIRTTRGHTQYVDFVRGVLPGSSVSNSTQNMLAGRNRTLVNALKAHKVSLIPRVRDRCLVAKAA